MDNLPFFGVLSGLVGAEGCGLTCTLAILGSLLVPVVVGYFGSPLFVWTIAFLAIGWAWAVPLWLLIGFAAVLSIFLIKPIRAKIISSNLMQLVKALDVMPKISATERTALEAGVVWVEGDLFSGKPDFEKIMKESYPQLTAEEQAFVDGPVQKLCDLIKPWDVWKTRDLSPEVWEFIKREKFLGMIIPKEYGGLEFTALAHSQVIMKIASRSVTGAVTVMVPNSLGPAELLIHYGTDAQKKHYLPRLARGEDIPCFALTEPTAGSDAASILAEGVIFKDKDGQIKIRLTWNKRWITLAAISTVLGLAFRLRDPENLLGKGENVGITCALIPTNLPGVMIGQRHDPLGVPFYNCPTRGKDVVIGIDDIIGGLGGVGQGWAMLMDCLSAGRGISLPAQGTGGAKLVSYVASAHSAVRRQFGLSIGRFEGVEEPLARIGGYTYILEALRRFTLGALDKGIKPPVITAIAKYNATELSRKVINDGMDILGGAAISLGPRNTIGEIYIATPIGITVEGANILTRTLMIFGQGALRAHPFAFKVIDALEKGDVKNFDLAFFGLFGHTLRNGFRAFVLSITRGYVASIPGNSGPMAIYYRRLVWSSATFAFWTDIAMGTLGGSLKAKQKLTGRFADILSWMYISTAVLRRWEADGRKQEDLAFVRFSLKYGLQQIQNGFDGIFDNLEIPGLSWFVKGWIGAWSRINSLSSHITDKLTHGIAEPMLHDTDVRKRLIDGIYLSSNPEEQMGRLAHAFKVVNATDAAERKIKKAIREGVLPKNKIQKLVPEALAKNVITEEDKNILEMSESVRFDAIQVDDFSQHEFQSTAATSSLSGLSRL